MKRKELRDVCGTVESARKSDAFAGKRKVRAPTLKMQKQLAFPAFVSSPLPAPPPRPIPPPRVPTQLGRTCPLALLSSSSSSSTSTSRRRRTAGMRRRSRSRSRSRPPSPSRPTPPKRTRSGRTLRSSPPHRPALPLLTQHAARPRTRKSRTATSTSRPHMHVHVHHGGPEHDRALPSSIGKSASRVPRLGPRPCNSLSRLTRACRSNVKLLRGRAVSKNARLSTSGPALLPPQPRQGPASSAAAAHTTTST